LESTIEEEQHRVKNNRLFFDEDGEEIREHQTPSAVINKGLDEMAKGQSCYQPENLNTCRIVA